MPTTVALHLVILIEEFQSLNQRSGRFTLVKMGETSLQLGRELFELAGQGHLIKSLLT